MTAPLVLCEQPPNAVEPERPTALPLGSRRALRAGARLTTLRWTASVDGP